LFVEGPGLERSAAAEFVFRPLSHDLFAADRVAEMVSQTSLCLAHICPGTPPTSRLGL
jgi:hypothetical protein